MKKKTKWILGGITSAIVLVCLAGFIYFQFFFTLDLFEEGPTKEVNLNGWEELERGMSKAEVSSLLGESVSKFGPGTIGTNDYTVPETWEYSWTIGFSLFGGEHPKAYIVRFGEDGTLASWREPIDEGKNPEQNIGQVSSDGAPSDEPSM